MKHGYLYLSISVSGASIIAVEILGTRILGPFYGVGIFLWLALITVTLGALSAGYALGGKWADKKATCTRLSLLLCGAGFWLLLVPWLRHPLLRLTEPFGLRFAALIAAIILFLVPLMLLGMVGPYAIKLRTSSLDEVGRSAGNLFAISTAASAAAALLTGLILIPSLGVHRLTVAVGIILIATAMPGLFPKRLPAAKLIFPLVILAAGAAFDFGLRENEAQPEQGLIFRSQSLYGELRVVDDGSFRYLLIDGAIHAAVDTSSYGETLLPYVNAADIARNFFNESGRLLLISLGGGSIVEHYHRAGWDVDAVEIDPLVARVARDFFALRPAEARLFHMDGRQFLLSTGTAYDVIILDACGSGPIPFHLITRETFGIISSRLTPGGVLAINVEANGWEDKMVRSIAATLKTQFPNVLALPTMEPPNALGNVLLFASKRSLELREELPIPIDRFTRDYDRAHAWDNRFEPDTRGVPVLTDDRNCSDLWAEAINARERKNLNDMFMKQGVSW